MQLNLKQEPQPDRILASWVAYFLQAVQTIGQYTLSLHCPGVLFQKYTSIIHISSFQSSSLASITDISSSAVRHPNPQSCRKLCSVQGAQCSLSTSESVHNVYCAPAVYKCTQYFSSLSSVHSSDTNQLYLKPVLSSVWSVSPAAEFSTVLSAEGAH